MKLLSLEFKHYLVIIVAVCLVISVFTTSVSWIDPTDYGLASELPITFWIGLFLLGCLWYVGKDSRNFLIVSLVLSVCYLYFAPAIIRATPWISNSFYPFAESLLINEQGHLVDRSTALFVSYVDWPIFLYLASAITLVTGIPHNILLSFFPPLIVSLYGFFTVLILKDKLKLSYSLFAAAFVVGSLFVRQIYFGPQAVAYVFFLMALLLIKWIFFEDRGNLKLLGLLVFVCLVTTATHQLTSLMIMFLMFAVYLSYRFSSRKSTAIVFSLSIFLVVVWVGYNMYLAPGFFVTTVRHMSAILFGESELSLYNEPTRIIGSQPMLANFVASWGIVLLGVAVSLIGIFQIIRSILARRTYENLPFAVFMVFALAFFGLFAVAGEYGAHEAYQRAFMFGLVPISYLAVRVLSKKPKLLVLLVVVLLFLNIPAQYGGDTYRMATQPQLAGSNFVADTSPDEIDVVGKFTLYVRFYDPDKVINVVPIGLDFPYTTFNSSAVDEAIDEALTKVDYVTLSGLQTNYYKYFLGLDPLQDVDFDAKCNRIYANSQFTVFKPIN